MLHTATSQINAMTGRAAILMPRRCAYSLTATIASSTSANGAMSCVATRSASADAATPMHATESTTRRPDCRASTVAVAAYAASKAAATAGDIAWNRRHISHIIGETMSREVAAKKTPAAWRCLTDRRAATSHATAYAAATVATILR